ncbi:MAG TPA: hypothetical protein PKZ49_11710, partial [Nitrosomonas sp.]|nr:hypothetical protein [Nitrosomonas sp.]
NCAHSRIGRCAIHLHLVLASYSSGHENVSLNGMCTAAMRAPQARILCEGRFVVEQQNIAARGTDCSLAMCEPS